MLFVTSVDERRTGSKSNLKLDSTTDRKDGLLQEIMPVYRPGLLDKFSGWV